jgi:hypothetical protein
MQRRLSIHFHVISKGTQGYLFSRGESRNENSAKHSASDAESWPMPESGNFHTVEITNHYASAMPWPPSRLECELIQIWQQMMAELAQLLEQRVCAMCQHGTCPSQFHRRFAGFNLKNKSSSIPPLSNLIIST